jgi:hypothetical protein
MPRVVPSHIVALHVGAALARHKRAGRIEEREGKLYAMQLTETTQRAAS